MNGKIAVVAVMLIVVAVASVILFNTGVLSSLIATCGKNLTEESYTFTSDTTLSVKLCKSGGTETVMSYQVTDPNGVIYPSKGDQFTATPISNTPVSILVELTSGYTFHTRYSYYLYVSTDIMTHKYTVTR